MDTLHLNTYLDLIEALLQCARGDEWLLLQQHEQLVDAELVGVMAQVTEQLHQDGNLPAAKFLHHWTVQLTHLLQQNLPATTSTNSHVQSTVSQEVAIASQLAQPERQSCAVKAAAPTAATPLAKPSGQNNSHVDSSIDPLVEIEIAKQQPDLVITPPTPPQLSNRMEELLANISSRLEQLATSIDKHQDPANPLWYMSILEQADAQGWIVSSEEVEQLIGTKPHCAPDRSSFVRGCWKFEKAGKVGMHSAWRVTKEIFTPSIGGVGLPSGIVFTPTEAALRNQTPQPELDLSSPWAEK